MGLDAVICVVDCKIGANAEVPGNCAPAVSSDSSSGLGVCDGVVEGSSGGDTVFCSGVDV